jgi:hypothetical protein
MPNTMSQSENLSERAVGLDCQIRTAIKAAQQSISELGSLLAQMKRSELWKHLPASYRGFEDYARAVLGPIAHSTLYDLLAADSLTRGQHGIPPAIVDKLGVKRAAQLARLKPDDRTPAVIKTALNSSLPKTKAVVQAIINIDLPEEDRREATVLFARNLAAATADQMESLEEDGQFMEGIRDGDTSVTLRSKFWYYVCVDFQERHKRELAEGREYREALEATKRQSARPAADNDQDPPERESFRL